MKVGALRGSMRVNGQPFTGHKMKKISGFVFQDDVILDTMTVREAIFMAALLRLPQSFTLAQKRVRVDEIISLLHLQKAQDTVVGSALLKGISGGERKRTAIAMQVRTGGHTFGCLLGMHTRISYLYAYAYVYACSYVSTFVCCHGMHMAAGHQSLRAVPG